MEEAAEEARGSGVTLQMPSDGGFLARARESLCVRGGEGPGPETALASAACCSAAVASATKVTVVEKLIPIRSGLTAVPVRGQAVVASICA